jgi:hypothetical protein
MRGVVGSQKPVHPVPVFANNTGLIDGNVYPSKFTAGAHRHFDRAVVDNLPLTTALAVGFDIFRHVTPQAFSGYILALGCGFYTLAGLHPA